MVSAVLLGVGLSVYVSFARITHIDTVPAKLFYGSCIGTSLVAFFLTSRICRALDYQSQLFVLIPLALGMTASLRPAYWVMDSRYCRGLFVGQRRSFLLGTALLFASLACIGYGYPFRRCWMGAKMSNAVCLSGHILFYDASGNVYARMPGRGIGIVSASQHVVCMFERSVKDGTAIRQYQVGKVDNNARYFIPSSPVIVAIYAVPTGDEYVDLQLIANHVFDKSSRINASEPPLAPTIVAVREVTIPLRAGAADVAK